MVAMPADKEAPRRGPRPGPEGVRGGIMGFRPTAPERAAVIAAAGEEGVAGWLRRLARLAAGMDAHLVLREAWVPERDRPQSPCACGADDWRPGEVTAGVWTCGACGAVVMVRRDSTEG